MRLLLLSDIHANLPALEAVLASARTRGYDETLFLGDALGYGPFPSEVLAVLRDLGARCVLGNHDAWAVHLASAGRVTQPELGVPREGGVVLQAIRWQLERLTPEAVAQVTAWPATLDLSLGSETMRLRHGSPGSLLQYVNSLASAREAFTQWAGRLCAVGHTHLPSVYASVQAPVGEWVKHQPLSDGGTFPLPPGARAILNPGSVGQPRDGDPRASYGLLDVARSTFEVVRVPYDVAATREAVVRAGLPEVLGARLLVGK